MENGKIAQKNLPEAKSSVTYSLTSKDGFNILYTVREESGKKLLEIMESIEKELLEKGYKPQVKFQGRAPVEKDWTGEKCPKDGGRLYKIITKTGKKLIKCENSKFNPQTRTPYGCDYIQWEEDLRAKKVETFNENYGDPDEKYY